MPIVLLNIIKHLRDKSFETVLINLKLMYNFATLSESTLLTLGTKIPQKKLLREINMALKRLSKHVSFHISMSRHSAKWPQMPSVTSPAGAGPSQRGRCTHAVWKKDLWLTCHKETRNWCINMNTERDILVKKHKTPIFLRVTKNNSITSNPTLQYFKKLREVLAEMRITWAAGKWIHRSAQKLNFQMWTPLHSVNYKDIYI